MDSNNVHSVLITGGSRGIGKETVDEFLRNDYEVCAPSRSELDLTSQESVCNFIKDNSEKFDILINNAGINEINLIGELNQTDINNMMMTNLTSPLMLIDGFVKYMKNKGFGRIVNIASIWSVTSKPGRGVYSATKRGLHGITTTAAAEYAKYGVLVNTVSPGFTLTDLTRKNNTPEQISEISSNIPIGRMADVSEIAKVIFYLGSENNTYINGQNIVVDGGFSIC